MRKRRNTGTWLRRDLKKSLENYKLKHTVLAKEKGLSEELAKALTLTQARQLLFGRKR